MYCYEGSIFVAGSSIQWLRDKLFLFKKSKETEKLYLEANDNEDVIVIPALTGLGAPHWQPKVRGGIFGISRNTSISDIVKSTLDSLTFQTYELIEAMEKDSKTKIKEMKVDGGMVANNPFIQSISNTLQIKIIRPQNTETTALGVAYLAGLNSGHIKNIQKIKKLWKVDKTFKPKVKKNEIQIKINKWKKSIKLLIKYFS